MVIYAEYLFAENLITGGIILILTGKIAGIKMKKSLLAFGSVLCGAYSFILFWDNLLPWISILSKLIFSLVVVLLVFPTKRLRQLARTVMIFYLVSFAMGGITIGAVYFMGFSGVTQNSAIYLEKFSYMNIVIGCTLTYLSLCIFAGFIKARFLREKTTADVYIELENKRVKMKGMLDTGNALTDPFTGKPVLIISLAGAKKILPSDIGELVLKDDKEQITYERLKESSFANRIRLIPYKSIGEEKGILIGIRPDKIRLEIHGQQDKHNPLIMPDGVILAIYKGVFSSENKEDGYSILLHPSAMEGGIACNV